MSTTISDSNIDAEPRSIRVEPWTEFPKQSYSIHHDEFCHEKNLVAKFQSRGSKSALCIKEILNNSHGKWHFQDDIKLWFMLPNNHSLCTRVKSTNYIKVHYDHGLYTLNNALWNLYGSFWTDKSLSKSSFRIGLQSVHPRCTSDNRLRFNTTGDLETVHFYNRTLAYWKQTKFGLLTVIDLTHKVLQKNNLLVGHVFQDRHEVFVRLENSDFRTINPHLKNYMELWDTAIVNYVGRLNQTVKVGVQGQLCLKGNKLKKVQAVIEKILPEQGIILKTKFSNNRDAAFLVKRALWGYEDLLTFSAGLGFKNALCQKRITNWGIQLDFNI